MRLKYLVSIVIVSVIFVYGLSTLLHPEFNRYLNRVGKAQYYTVILEDGKIDPKASGKILTTFRYRLPAYNANGDKWLLDFSAIKQTTPSCLFTVVRQDKRYCDGLGGSVT